jgi:hypothetical protein
MKLKTQYKNLSFNFIKSRGWEGNHVIIYDDNYPFSCSVPLRVLKGALEIGEDFMTSNGGKNFILPTYKVKELVNEIMEEYFD